jgi:hypothetical protein
MAQSLPVRRAAAQPAAHEHSAALDPPRKPQLAAAPATPR